MKKIIVSLAVLMLSAHVFAQQAEEITKDNSWLKAGITAGVPIGNLSNVSSFTLGLDLKGQIMSTNHVGVGITTGYNQFFAKSGYSSLGNIPLGAFIRYYPYSHGFFAGLDAGYGFLTGNYWGSNGGFYLRPQLGYHNYSWNFFAFYNNIFRSSSNGDDIQYAGIGATYNIHFK